MLTHIPEMYCCFSPCFGLPTTSPRTMHWITKVLRWLSVKAPRDVKHADLADLLKGYARSKVKETFSFEKDQQPQGFGISRIVFSYLSTIFC